MKKMLKLCLVCVVLLVGTSSYAIDGNKNFYLHVLKSEGRHITFGLNNLQKASLAIYEKNGSLLYFENASGKGGILKTFNLEEFPAGTYYLQIEDASQKARYQINVTCSESTLSTEIVSQVYKTNHNNTANLAVR